MKLETKDKLILRLYQQDNLSMAQIAEKLKLSPSTVRYWLDKNNVKRRTRSEAINDWYLTKFHKAPFQLKDRLSDSEQLLKVAGIMLYWGEGAKSGNVVKFTNSDPDMIKLFLKFLRNICGIDEKRLKALLHIYPDHNEKELLLFWIEETKIPKERFYKSYLHVGKKGTYKQKSKFGTLTINYPDKRLLKLILGWINGYKK
jgi:DNA-binding Lrp family transcriptional regulator